MKKTSLLAIIIVSFTLVFAACGKDNSGSTPTPAKPAGQGAGDLGGIGGGAKAPTGGTDPTNPVKTPAPGAQNCAVGANFFGSCVQKDKICIDYSGVYAQVAEAIKKSCVENDGGIFSNAACSLEGISGSCKVSTGTVIEVVLRFPQDMKQADVSMGCTAQNNATFCAP
ncbi:hypothetical protein WDW37_18060 [Bdellovibrionota bacterium FG-1]